MPAGFGKAPKTAKTLYFTGVAGVVKTSKKPHTHCNHWVARLFEGQKPHKRSNFNVFGV